MIDYTARKYGYDKVAQIITFGTMGARAALRDVGRVMDIPLNEVDRVAKLIPAIPGKPVTIAEALKDVPEFQAAYNDPEKPFVTSGIRIGSPAMTTRGFKELEAEKLSHLIADVLDAPNDDAVIARVVAEVKKLTAQFPVYGE